MSYFPGIGITSPGRAMAPAAVEESAAVGELYEDNLAIWLRSDRYTNFNQQFGDPAIINGWGSESKIMPLFFYPVSNSPAKVLDSINGLPALNFAANNTVLQLPPLNDQFTNSSYNNEMTFIVVAKFPSAVPDIVSFIVKKDSVFQYCFGVHLNRIWVPYTNSAGTFTETFSSTVSNLTSWNVFSATIKTSIKYYQNKTSLGSTAVVGTFGRSNFNDRLRVGGDPQFPTVRQPQLIAEIRLYNKELPEEDLFSVIDSLNEKYNIF